MGRAMNEANEPKVIGSAELSAYERWELPTVDALAPAPRRANPATPTAEEGAEQLTSQSTNAATLAGRAWKQGFDEGLEAGICAGAEQVQSLLTTLGAGVDALVQPTQVVDAALEDALARVAMAIARQVIRRELKVDPAQIVAVVREAVKALPLSTQEVRIMVHPDDARILTNLVAIEESHVQWKLVENPLMTPGGCEIETTNSRVDATLDSRLNQIAAQIFGRERREDRHRGSSAESTREFTPSGEGGE